MTHGSKSGVTHFTAGSDEEALDLTRDLIGLLPSNNLSGVPNKSLGDSAERLCESLDSVIPEDPNKPYDVNDVIEAILDAAHTGEVGDGKVFVTPVEEAIRIRTGETGTEAV